VWIRLISVFLVRVILIVLASEFTPLGVIFHSSNCNLS